MEWAHVEHMLCPHIIHSSDDCFMHFKSLFTGHCIFYIVYGDSLDYSLYAGGESKLSS